MGVSPHVSLGQNFARLAIISRKCHNFIIINNIIIKIEVYLLLSASSMVASFIQYSRIKRS